MNHQEDERAYEVFIDLLADLLLEHLSAESAGAEEKGNNGQNEPEPSVF